MKRIFLVKGFLLDDAFCQEIIKIGVDYLATVINAIINCLGIKKYLIIGGFGLAMGEGYKKLLTDSVLNKNPYTIVLDNEEELIVMLEKTDNHCIHGAGMYGVSKLKGRDKIWT